MKIENSLDNSDSGRVCKHCKTVMSTNTRMADNALGKARYKHLVVEAIDKACKTCLPSSNQKVSVSLTEQHAFDGAAPEQLIDLVIESYLVAVTAGLLAVTVGATVVDREYLSRRFSAMAAQDSRKLVEESPRQVKWLNYYRILTNENRMTKHIVLDPQEYGGEFGFNKGDCELFLGRGDDLDSTILVTNSFGKKLFVFKSGSHKAFAGVLCFAQGEMQTLFQKMATPGSNKLEPNPSAGDYKKQRAAYDGLKDYLRNKLDGFLSRSDAADEAERYPHGEPDPSGMEDVAKAREPQPATEDVAASDLPIGKPGTKVVDFNNVCDLRYTKPVSLTYFGEKMLGCSSWAELYTTFISNLNARYPQIFKPGMSFSDKGSLRVDLLDKRNRAGMVSPKSVPGTSLYLETNLSANSIVVKIKYLLDKCRINYRNVIVEYRAQVPYASEIPTSDTTGEALHEEQQASVKEEFDYNGFSSFLLSHESIEVSSCRSYLSSLKSAEDYAFSHRFAHHKLLTMDLEEARATAKALLRNSKFVSLNKQGHNRYSASIKKLLKFLDMNGDHRKQIRMEGIHSSARCLNSLSISPGRSNGGAEGASNNCKFDKDMQGHEFFESGKDGACNDDHFEKPAMDRWIKYDFFNEESFKWTVPVWCVVGNKVVEGNNWAKILSTVVENEIRKSNANINELYRRPLLFETKGLPFLMRERIDGCNCARLSNGFWINLEYDIPSLIRLIHAFCLQAGYSNNQILLYGVLRESIVAFQIPGEKKEQNDSIAIIMDAIRSNYPNGLRFDDTMVALLEKTLSIKIDQSTRATLEKIMFCRRDGLRFLSDDIGNQEQRQLVSKDSILERIQEYGCVELASLFSFFTNAGTASCFRDEDDFGDYLMFLYPNDIRINCPLNSKIVRRRDELVEDVLKIAASKVKKTIEGKGRVAQKEIIKSYPLYTAVLIDALVAKYANNIVSTKINGIPYYQAVESLEFVNKGFSQTLNSVLDEIEAINLTPSQEAIHALLSIKLGYNLRLKYGISDDKTFRYIVSLYYSGSQKRNWKAGNFVKVGF